MKKIIISVITVILAVTLLAGCTPASELIPPTTAKPNGILLPDGGGNGADFSGSVVSSESFAIYAGEYNYFFLQMLYGVADSLENEYGVDLDKSLKEQYIENSDTTWFDFVRDKTLDYMKTLLYVYETAVAADKNYKKSADEYLDNTVIPALKQMSGNDPSAYLNEIYGGTVSYSNYLNAAYLEYIYGLYLENTIAAKADSLTLDEVSAYADTMTGDKDPTPTRKAAYIRVPDGKNKATELVESFAAGSEKTPEAIRKLAYDNGYSNYTDLFVPDDEAMPDIADWLFAPERALLDGGAVSVKGDSYYAVFYLGDGEAAYLFKARYELADNSVSENIKNGVKNYQRFKEDADKLDSVNV